MGKRNRERIERINAGKEMPRSITNPSLPSKFRSLLGKMAVISKSQVGREQRRDNVRLQKVFERKDEIQKQREEKDKLAKLTRRDTANVSP